MTTNSQHKNRASLREICHVNSNEAGDRFVGIRVDSDEARVYFPIGYSLPDTESAIRADIKHLIRVLTEFTTKEERLIAQSSHLDKQTVYFPINAYLGVIEYFLANGGRYYIETEKNFITASNGKQNWSRTIKRHKPLLQEQESGDYSLIFTKYEVRVSSPNSNKLITQINRYCVYEALKKIGWLYIDYEPEKPGPHPDIRTSVAILQSKLVNTNDDRKRALFQNMKNMLEYLDEKTTSKQYYFGTDTFEHVWERLVDRAFGIKDKAKFFPRSKWILKYGKDLETRPLMPDTIMILNNKYYILDAKYYRYGITGNPNHLPECSSILKQIAYGEKVKSELVKNGIKSDVFNAFIMPFNKSRHTFGKSDENIIKVGEATGDWLFVSEENHLEYHNYQRIQGIVIDIRFLFYNYNSKLQNEREILANCIEDGLENKTEFKNKTFADINFPLSFDNEFDVMKAAEDNSSAKFNKSE